MPHNKSSGWAFPVSKLIHLCNNRPWNNNTPAIENIKKKNKSIAIVLISIGIAEVKDYRIIFSFLDLEIVFNGIKILNNLIDYKVLPELTSVGNQLVTTIIKSNILKWSLRYAFFPKINPLPIIFKHISHV